MFKLLASVTLIGLIAAPAVLSAANLSVTGSATSSQQSVIQLEEQLISLLRELVQLLTTQLHATRQRPGNVVAPAPTPTPDAVPTTTTATTTSQASCVAGYHECTGANCLHVGVIVTAPYYCITSTNPFTVVPIPAGAVWPAASCDNVDQTPLTTISEAADYFGDPLPGECVPDDPTSAL